tara:strand:+ start:1525 stop:3018 length:1494 start_codon:yes stop_codon:yes gene_type:complete
MANQLPAILNVATIPSIENMNIKTEVLDPITITTQQAVFQIPKTGVLDGGSMLQIGITGNPQNFLPFNTGIHGAIRSVFLKAGGQVIASNDDYAYYTTMARQFDTPEHRAYVDMVKSGACGDRWASPESGRLAFRDANATSNANPLLSSNSCPLFLRPTTNDSTTPLFSIPLSTLIPMMKTRQLPLMAIKEHIYLEINFNTQGANAPGLITCISQGNDANSAVAISQTNIKFMSDHLYYTDEKMNQVLAQSMSQDGLAILYEDVITTTHQVPPGVAAAGSVANQIVERPLAVSGKTVRNILIQDKNQGEVHNIFGNYISRDLMAGSAYNFRINDQRVYDRDLENPARKYNELREVFGLSLYVPNQLYSYDADTDKADAQRRVIQNSLGTGLVEGYQLPNGASTLIVDAGNGNINDLRACSHYVGYDATKTGANVLGNGSKIGVKPIDVIKTYKRVADTAAGGNYGLVAGQNSAREMRIFCGVEKNMLIRGGEITLSA